MGKDGGNPIRSRGAIGPDLLVLAEARTALHAPHKAKAATDQKLSSHLFGLSSFTSAIPNKILCGPSVP